MSERDLQRLVSRFSWGIIHLTLLSGGVYLCTKALGWQAGVGLGLLAVYLKLGKLQEGDS